MLDFPNNPNTNDEFPSPPVVGVPTWMWDGEKWLRMARPAGMQSVSADHVSVLGDGTSEPETDTVGKLRVGTVDGGEYSK